MMSSSEDDCDEGDDGDIVSQLMLKVEEQDSQMRMAAEIGQSLLEKNECLSSDLEESEGERSRLEALLGEITYRNKELEDALARVGESDASHVQDLQTANERMQLQLSRQQDEIDELRSVCSQQQESIRRAEVAATEAQQIADEDRLSGMVMTPRGGHFVTPEKAQVESLRLEVEEHQESARKTEEAHSAERARHTLELARLQRQLENQCELAQNLQLESKEWEVERMKLAQAAERGTAELANVQLQRALESAHTPFDASASAVTPGPNHQSLAAELGADFSSTIGGDELECGSSNAGGADIPLEAIPPIQTARNNLSGVAAGDHPSTYGCVSI